jgi:hypothetical protein
MSTHDTAAATGRFSVPRGEALLPAALILDAVVTAANGVAYLAAASLLDEPLGLPADFLRGIGAFLLVYALLVWFARTASLVRVVIAGNVAWAVASVALVVFDWGTPTTGGAVWIVLQAAVVGGFAALQRAGLRGSAM